MKHTNIRKVAVGVTLALCASPSFAKSILVTGSIDAVSPKVEFPTVKDQQAFVSPLNFVAKEAKLSGCRLTGDPAVAMKDHGDELVCLFEWTELPRGLSAAGMEARGFLLAEGTHKLGYKISYFSGSKLEKVLIKEGSTSISAVAPKPPVISKITTQLDTGTQIGEAVTNNKRAGGLKTLTVTVEPRSYRQNVRLKNVDSCTVEIGKDSCSMDVSTVSASDDKDSPLGQKVFKLWSDSDNNYFLPNNVIKAVDFKVKWDYRTPEIKAFAMQARSDESAEPISKEVDGTYFVVDNEQAKLVVTSPHEGLPGDWWLPEAKIEFVPDPSFKPQIPAFEIDGHTINSDSSNAVVQPQKSFVVVPSGPPAFVEGKYIFTFDLKQVADGKFLPKVTVNDRYDNKLEKTLDPVVFDREPPTVQLFYKQGRFNNDGKVYFLQDLTAVALDTFDGGAKINEIRVNGYRVDLEGKQEFVKRLAPKDDFSLAPQHTYPLTVKVSDSAGNTFIKSFNIAYMPMDYELESAGTKFYADVQRIKLKVQQTSGVQCPLYESESEILKYPFQYGEEQRCILEWTGTPNGASGVYVRGQALMTGHFEDTSKNTDNAINYRVWMYDKHGRKALAADETNKMDVVSAPELTMTVIQNNALSENRFPVDLRGGTVTNVRAKGVNADMQIAIDDGETVKTQMVRQRGFGSADNSVGSRIRVHQGKLWQEKSITAHARYSLTDDLSTDATIKVLYVPNRNIIAHITNDGVRQLDNANPVIKFNLGAYDSEAGGVVYKPETQGEWTVYLAQERFDRKERKMYYDALTNKVKLDKSGTSLFTLDLSNVGYTNFRYVGVAELESPDKTYHRRIVTNSGVHRVLKSGEIDGDVRVSRVSNRVPFALSLTYLPKTRADNDAKGNIYWEQSSDGKSNWKRMPKFDGKWRARDIIKEAGHYFVRAKVENKYTKVESVSEVIHILGYKVPDLKIEGVRMLHDGEKGSITLMDHDHEAREGEGSIEWSTDNVNWTQGGNTYELTGEGKRIRIYARMRYSHNELAENAAYDYTRYNVLVKEPQPVRISVIHPRLIESGKPLDLEGKVSLQSILLETPIESEWELPDGTVIKGNKLHYVPTKSDAEAGVTKLRFRAWATGFRSKTFREETLFLRTWEYKFPEFKVNMKYRTRYAPMTAIASIRQIGQRLPVKMDWGYHFEPFPGMTIIEDKTDKGRISFMVDKPGLHQLLTTVKDDRGNEKTYTEIIEVLDPPEPKVSLKGRYSTRFMRAPLDAVFRASVRLGHPDDRVESCDWYLDDKLVGETKRSTTFTLMNIGEGNHVLKMKVKSKFGIEHDELLDVVVVPNKPPECNMDLKYYGSVTQVYANCKDTDGKMSTYNWYKNGEAINAHSGNIQLFLNKDETADIKVEGFDDSGDKSTDSISVSSKT
ncbi:Ig-like domain-containing protein [Photobacterium damselae]|uniref:Ig-like domain-containing protein n=1 Tax=Photobacterium damselae TaxID=38293 RepID=UPI0015A35E47|nr:Ig-like domain-containing protein [Photobacterium damselae]NVO60218.1 hypothetical protein [Photobacterium damselae subsp. damselae]WIH21836.1 hypothetical protein KQY33_20595 [Photobacterium damselae]